MRLTLAILFLTAISAQAQFKSYQMLNAPFGARNAALGGKVVSLADGDLMQFVHNPAVLDSVAVTEAAINFSPYFLGIYAFNGAYQGQFGKLGKLAIGMTYLNYGEFAQTAPNGDDLGTFQAQDYVIVVGKSHRVGSFSLGSNVKYAYSGIAGYGSSLLLMDMGGIYRSPTMDFTVGMVFKNMGFVINRYTEGSISQVPFDVQISTSIKPQYMPFRFSLSAHGLADRDVYFQDEGSLNNSRSVELADQILRRINVGAELIIHPNVQFLFGYSHMRRQELKLVDAAYGAGFSYGFMIGIKQFKIRYSHATYHAAGGTDFFSIQTRLNSFNKIL